MFKIIVIEMIFMNFNNVMNKKNNIQKGNF